tara:strand:+ start:297 stop:476 length:180 start_codon:yes stop_codon:yes gene_type:complete
VQARPVAIVGGVCIFDSGILRKWKWWGGRRELCRLLLDENVVELLYIAIGNGCFAATTN